MTEKIINIVITAAVDYLIVADYSILCYYSVIVTNPGLCIIQN